MAWNQRDVMEERIKFVIRTSSGKECFSKVCREFGISRDTGYLWKRRFESTQSALSLAEKSRRPKTFPHKTSEDIEKKVIELRKKWGWGARKLQVLLERKHKIKLPERTINRILGRANLIDQSTSKKIAIKRFEREKPNQLWQMDFKGEFKNNGLTCFPLTLLDDCSRYSIIIRALSGTKTAPVEKSLIKAFEQFGLPDAILTDHGAPWWATHSEHGLTKLSVALIKQGIKLYFSGVGHPQTQGKLERFHRTLKERVNRTSRPTTLAKWQSLFDSIRNEYNNIRPHEALKMDVPSNRYSTSTKQYQSKPRVWEYPKEEIIETVDISGCIRHSGKHLFVSHSLIGEKVMIQELKSNLIITFRHMQIREINCLTGMGTPFPALKV